MYSPQIGDTILFPNPGDGVGTFTVEQCVNRGTAFEGYIVRNQESGELVIQSYPTHFLKWHAGLLTDPAPVPSPALTLPPLRVPCLYCTEWTDERDSRDIPTCPNCRHAYEGGLSNYRQGWQLAKHRIESNTAGSRQMASKFAGTCAECHERFVAGTLIIWGKHAGTIHADCDECYRAGQIDKLYATLNGRLQLRMDRQKPR